MMIQPRYAGIFYEKDFGMLDKQIKKCFTSIFGPGELPVEKREGRLNCVIVPHAGYMYSGACAAWAYKEIAEHEVPDTYVIIAPDHNGVCDKITTCTQDFNTLFGVVFVNKLFASELKKKCDIVDKDIYEHAIEVQLPFLQFVNKEYIGRLKILPLIVPSAQDVDALAEAITDINENIVVIASSDFTHYGYNYGYVPFETDIKENIKKIDMAAINMILNVDAKGFLDYAKKTTICGRYAIYAALKILENLFVKSGKLLQYYTSGDVVNDYSNSVSYAAIKF